MSEYTYYEHGYTMIPVHYDACGCDAIRPILHSNFSQLALVSTDGVLHSTTVCQNCSPLTKKQVFERYEREMRDGK